MFQALRGYLRSTGRNGFIRSASRLACALLLALLLPAIACAYTVVLRSGRRIEILSEFTVSRLTLTYEVAPGINVTLLMSSIDIPATERANNESAGSLLKRVEKSPVNTAATAQARPKPRELTQADIEAARLRRLKSEQDYERRRIELGLPSLEESRRRTEEETRRMREESLKSRMEESQSEAYWRERALFLKTDIATLDAQIVYVRERLAELPDYSTLGAYSFITGTSTTFPLRRPYTTFPAVTGNPGFMRGVNGTGAQVAGFLAFDGSGAARGQAQLNAGLSRGNFGRRAITARGITFSGVSVFGLPSSNYDYSYERANLISRFHELETARAGLQARWRLLEEEARRAGAQPGWLRP
ncbi:MAG: hypothetical protein QOJ02_571 [Acidobacteriota bacterium]|nr:hypothetical protein [Acidobacteriota bacterium]